MERGELALWLRLTLTPGVGNATARSLLASFGLPETIFRQTATALRQVVSEKLALALAQELPGTGCMPMPARIRRTHVEPY